MLKFLDHDRPAKIRAVKEVYVATQTVLGAEINASDLMEQYCSGLEEARQRLIEKGAAPQIVLTPKVEIAREYNLVEGLPEKDSKFYFICQIEVQDPTLGAWLAVTWLATDLIEYEKLHSDNKISWINEVEHSAADENGAMRRAMEMLTAKAASDLGRNDVAILQERIREIHKDLFGQ